MSGPSPVARVLLLLVRAYRRGLSPLLPPRCRFAPTCSVYAVEALQTHGAARGTWLTLRRLARCQPFHPGGHDPVPPRRPSMGDDGGGTPPAAGTAPGPGSSAVRPSASSSAPGAPS